MAGKEAQKGAGDEQISAGDSNVAGVFTLQRTLCGPENGGTGMAGSPPGRTAIPLLRILPCGQTAQRKDEFTVQPPPCGDCSRGGGPEKSAV